MIFFLSHFRALASKISLDSSGRLVHRDTGKIILPYEHFANAVILKHMAGPGGMHLSIDSTVKSVFDSYSCGKDNFGFDRDFIVEVTRSHTRNVIFPHNSLLLSPGREFLSIQLVSLLQRPINPFRTTPTASELSSTSNEHEHGLHLTNAPKSLADAASSQHQ